MALFGPRSYPSIPQTRYIRYREGVGGFQWPAGARYPEVVRDKLRTGFWMPGCMGGCRGNPQETGSGVGRGIGWAHGRAAGIQGGSE